MNVFADFHHGDLYYSLQLLLEKRLGWNLYRPIGLDWYYKGYWKIADPYDNPLPTAKQYLATDTREWNAYNNLNGDYTANDGIYSVFDPVHGVHQKAITFEKFLDMPIDIVISSIPAHNASFAELIRDYKPLAKHIAQIGNRWEIPEVKNVMASILPVPTNKHVVFYHQEFDRTIFRSIPPRHHDIIRSFVNLLPQREIYDLYQAALPDFQFEAYGAGCPDGTVSMIEDIAKKMQSSAFGWHLKPGGDGFGHVIHNWFASGRPVIVNGSHYKDTLAGALLVDGKTCIDLEATGYFENLNRIRYWSLPENHAEMCKNAGQRFDEIVNFDEEFIKIKRFLENLS